jgi:hypothetical protein
LAIKPITINSCIKLSNNFKKRIERVCKADENGSYVLSAYLIAQLGKNYNLEYKKRIDGKRLLKIAQDTLTDIKYQIGGVVAFLECEDSKDDFLLNFYSDNGYSLFGNRNSEKNKKLHQFIKAL